MDLRAKIAKKFVYYSSLNALDVNGLASFVSENFEYSNEHELLDAIGSMPKKITDNTTALKFLLYQDVQNGLARQEFLNGANEFSEDVIAELYERIILEFNKIGLSLETYPEISLVDNYPHPYQNVKGVALAPDETDRARYGIPYAILIRKGSVDPTILPILIAHELVHFFVKDEGLLARGLEEGFADFLAFFLVGPKIIPERALRNYFLSKRITPKSGAPRFRTYLDYIRVALGIYTFRGLAGIIDPIKSGRRAIKELEIAALDKQGFAMIGSEAKLADDVHEETLNLAWSMINNHPIYEIVDPVSFCFICSQFSNEFREAFCADALSAQTRIEEKVFGCVVSDEGQIEFEDFETLYRSGVLRFDLGEGA